MKIKELSFAEFTELLNFVEGYFAEDDEKHAKMLVVLRKFFPTLDGFQLILLMNLITLKTEEAFNDFLTGAGESQFDPTGKSKPSEMNFGTVNLDMLDSIYMSPLKDDSKQNVKRHKREVIEARELTNVKKLKCDNYEAIKKAYLRRSNKAFNILELQTVEKNLEMLNLSNTILGKSIEYIKTRSVENGRLFFEHLSSRISAVAQDKEFKDQRNEEYFKILKEVSN